MNEERPKDIIEYAIDIIVGVVGIALLIYLKANYSEAVGSWIMSFFQ